MITPSILTCSHQTENLRGAFAMRKQITIGLGTIIGLNGSRHDCLNIPYILLFNLFKDIYKYNTNEFLKYYSDCLLDGSGREKQR